MIGVVIYLPDLEPSLNAMSGVPRWALRERWGQRVQALISCAQSGLKGEGFWCILDPFYYRRRDAPLPGSFSWLGLYGFVDIDCCVWGSPVEA